MNHISRREFLRTVPMLALPAPSPELSNVSMRLKLGVGAGGLLSVDHLSLNRARGTPGGGFTGNLLATGPDLTLRSGTALLPEGMEWQSARVNPALEVSGSPSPQGGWLKVGNILVGPEERPVARERWTIELNADRLSWQIEREFLREVRVLADRFPALVFRTHAEGRFSEIPGFLDPGMRLRGTDAFPLMFPKSEWYEAISPNRSQAIHLAPSGLVLASDLAAGFFSYAKTCADGTAAAVALGAESVDRSAGIETRRRGDVQRQNWRLRLEPNPGVAPFLLSLPDELLAEQTRSFAAVHNQWMGWMFGNNPASVPILHEMGWYPMIQSVYAGSPGTEGALARELQFFAESGVENSGYVFPRWWMKGYYRVVWGNLMDQVPHFILAMYFHAINTGRREFLHAMMPALDRVGRYMLALDRDGDGVVEVPGTSGLADGGRDCSNWYDIVKFGHKDAYVNAYCVMALEAMAEMKAFLGESAAAAQYRRAHRRAVEGFNRVFWDDADGFYRDWVDVREKMPESGRRYFYTDHNLLAIVCGIAGRARAARILDNLDRRYGELCREFKLRREAMYATPCNMIPVTQLGDLVDFGALGNQRVFPNYENGCSFFHTTGLEIAARGAAGQSDRAYETFERVMRYGYARNRLWGAALKWDTGELISEPLNDALLVLWGFVRGCFGIRPTLRGLTTAGPPARRMNGARHTFQFLGNEVTVKVVNGKLAW